MRENCGSGFSFPESSEGWLRWRDDTGPARVVGSLRWFRRGCGGGKRKEKKRRGILSLMCQREKEVCLAELKEKRGEEVEGRVGKKEPLARTTEGRKERRAISSPFLFSLSVEKGGRGRARGTDGKKCLGGGGKMMKRICLGRDLLSRMRRSPQSFRTLSTFSFFLSFFFCFLPRFFWRSIFAKKETHTISLTGSLSNHGLQWLLSGGEIALPSSTIQKDPLLAKH